METDSLDPLGNDWKLRGERGTARLRERAVEKDAGEFVPVAGIESILLTLASDVQGTLSRIIDEFRAIGIPDDAVAKAEEVLTDAKLQISVALDGAANRAADQVDAMESELESQIETPQVSGPSDRKKAHTGKPATGNMSPRVKGARK